MINEEDMPGEIWKKLRLGLWQWGWRTVTVRKNGWIMRKRHVYCLCGYLDGAG